MDSSYYLKPYKKYHYCVISAGNYKPALGEARPLLAV
jgi:hypothetical protein